LEIDWNLFQSDFQQELQDKKIIFEHQHYYNLGNVKTKLHDFISELQEKGIKKWYSTLLQELRPGLYDYLRHNFRHNDTIDWIYILINFFSTDTLQSFPFFHKRSKLLFSTQG